MPLAPGVRLGPYQILAQIGEGGMGEVYRARDTRLGRDVAVKVLPRHLASRPEARARFEREAKAVSSLNHPHICALYDVGREGGTDYIVMELIEGQTLARRLTAGALTTAEVLRFGAQVADALGRAHRAGVVHRDLKPGNVMLTKSGMKLMDFGLAKGIGSASSPSSLMTSRTATSSLTMEGSIVGTVHYMAPEQFEGKEADERSDLFALGTVLYEMATGKRAFEGKTPASVVASILKEEPPPIRSLDAMSPPALDRLVRQCLRKDPDERIQSAHDVQLQLEAIAEAGPARDESPSAPVARRNRLRERLAWGALASLLVLALVFRAPSRPAAIPPVLVSSILPAEGTSLVPGILGWALSPDGRRIAYVAGGARGTGLWVRALDSSKSTLLVAADDANCPFWSPDSRSVGFLSGGSLRKVDVADGQSLVLAPMRDCLGASWASDGSILYAPDRLSPILRISGTGGAPVAVTPPRTAGNDRVYSQPSLLPDGKHLLYTVNESWHGGKGTGVYVARMGGEDEKRLLPVLSNARFLEPGYLVYAREGSLRAHRFDASRLELIGEPIPLVDGVRYEGSPQSHLFSFSDNGLLVYDAGKEALTRLTWVDRNGVVLGTVGQPGYYFSPRISHDGKRIAYDLSETTAGMGDIWALDLDRGIPTRLTFDLLNESGPIWSPDDERLLFFRETSEQTDLLTISSDGTGQPETVLSNGSKNYSSDWSGVAKSIALEVATNRERGLFLYSTENRKAEPWPSTPFVQRQAKFSPDGRWISYDSDESGKVEVYVRGRSPDAGKWRVSSDGGAFSVWSRDGRELFYVASDSRVMSVPIRPGPTFERGTPVPLFKIPGELLSLVSLGIATQYDVSPDGRRFLMNLSTSPQGERSISLLSNWTSLLPR